MRVYALTFIQMPVYALMCVCILVDECVCMYAYLYITGLMNIHSADN